MPHSRKYYALLVGINDYPDPFTSLYGCIKDTENIAQYLEEWIQTQVENPEKRVSMFAEDIPIQHIGPLSILKLQDAQATYENIMKAFREFLAPAKKTQPEDHTMVEDVVWFHYSGHGSEAFTAEEFLKLEPNGKDQTLITYNKSYGVGQTHLADKEIAVLLHELATQDENGNPKEAPHIVVSLDCCHSGSGTRFSDFTLKTRNADVLPAMTRVAAQAKGHSFRDIQSYAGGYYHKLLQEEKPLSVPVAPHVLLSACESVQLAGDLEDGGVFTLGLLDALRKAKHNINYSDLYMQARISVQKIRKEAQTPTFEAIGEFDPYQRFLEACSLGSPDLYSIFYEKNTWQVNCGAIHGIPIKAEQAIFLDIMQEEQVIGKGQLVAIGAQKSQLAIDVKEGVELDTERLYQAQLRFLPLPPQLVWIHGDTEGVEALKKHWDKRKNILYMEDPEKKEDAQLEVEVQSRGFFIRDRIKHKQVFSWPKKDADDAKVIIDCLGKIVNWGRMINLNHEKSALLSKDWVDLEIRMSGNAPESQMPVLKGPQHRLLADPQSYHTREGAIYAGFHPIWKIKDPDQDLYAYMFHMREDYSIVSYEGEKVYRDDEHAGKTLVEFPMWTEGKGWGLGPKDEESTCYFKLIVCTEALDYQQLLQSALSGDRPINWNVKPMQVKNDWCSITMKVTMSRS